METEGDEKKYDSGSKIKNDCTITGDARAEKARCEQVSQSNTNP
jgi:ubiquitin